MNYFKWVLACAALVAVTSGVIVYWDIGHPFTFAIGILAGIASRVLHDYFVSGK